MPQNITDVSAFTDPVTAPADGDALNAASIIDNGIQALSNRTRYLADQAGGPSGADEWTYSDGARARTRVISPFAMTEGRTQVAAVQYWSVAQFISGGTAYSRTSQSDFAFLIDDVSRYLPVGGLLTAVDVMVAPGIARATVGDRITVDMARQNPNWGTPAIPVAVGPLFTATDDGTTNVQVISSGALPSGIFDHVSRASQIVLRIRAGNDAGTNKDDIHSIRLSYTVPGPNAF